MPIITPGDAELDLRPCDRKWMRMYPTQYVAVCDHGCHGAPADTYDAARTQLQRVEDDCEADNAPEDDEA